MVGGGGQVKKTTQGAQTGILWQNLNEKLKFIHHRCQFINKKTNKNLTRERLTKTIKTNKKERKYKNKGKTNKNERKYKNKGNT